MKRSALASLVGGALLSCAVVYVGNGEGARDLPATGFISKGLYFTLSQGPSSGNQGLWRIDRRGHLYSVLSRAFVPIALGPNAFIASSYRSSQQSLIIFSAGLNKPVEVPKSKLATCVAVSSSGRFVSFITGDLESYAQLPRNEVAFGFRGTVWVFDRLAGKTLVVENGLFPTSECPAWSTRSDRLAFVSQASPPSQWALLEYSAGAVSSVFRFVTAAPSVSYRTFDWRPGADVLDFLGGRDNLYEYSADSRDLQVINHSAISKLIHRADRSDPTFAFNVKYSPDGRRVAIRAGAYTAVIGTNGKELALLRGEFNGWGGDSGVLTLRAERAVVTLFLSNVIGKPAVRPIEKFFKSAVVSDPEGRWFGYATVARRIRVRSPTGAVLISRQFDFEPRVMGAAGPHGVLAAPASAY
jgi:hypothetical protein